MKYIAPTSTYLLLDLEMSNLIDHLLKSKFSSSSQTSFLHLLLILEVMLGNVQVSGCTI